MPLLPLCFIYFCWKVIHILLMGQEPLDTIPSAQVTRKYLRNFLVLPSRRPEVKPEYRIAQETTFELKNIVSLSLGDIQAIS